MDYKVLASFFDNRNRLIEALESGQMDKSAFIEAQYQSVMGAGLKPTKGPLRSVEEGLFNYQYYNCLAKWERNQARIMEFRDPSKGRAHRRNMDKYYDLKDRETRRIIEFYGLDDLDAYFIFIPAGRLEGHLFEVVLLREERMILHSADEGIRHWLVREGILKEGLRPSIIDQYIQSNYE